MKDKANNTNSNSSQVIYNIFLTSECSSNVEFDEFIAKFQDGENLGNAIFEFHNQEHFRIYIANNIILNFYRK